MTLSLVINVYIQQKHVPKKKKKKHVPLKEKLDKLSFLKIEYIHSVKENQKTRLRPKKKKNIYKILFL